MDVFRLPDHRRAQKEGGGAQLITPYTSGLEPFGVALTHNPFECSTTELAELPSVRNVVMWSGWFGEPPVDGVFPADPRTWMREGWDALWPMCEALARAARRARMRVLLRPNARHVLSDPGACLTFRKRADEEGWGDALGLLVDPCGFLTSAMLPNAEDHLRRAFEYLAQDSEGVVLTNVDRPRFTDGDGLVQTPVHRGLVPVALLADQAARHGLTRRPILLLDDQMGAQIRALRVG